MSCIAASDVVVVAKGRRWSGLRVCGTCMVEGGWGVCEEDSVERKSGRGVFWSGRVVGWPVVLGARVERVCATRGDGAPLAGVAVRDAGAFESRGCMYTGRAKKEGEEGKGRCSTVIKREAQPPGPGDQWVDRRPMSARFRWSGTPAAAAPQRSGRATAATEARKRVCSPCARASVC